MSSPALAVIQQAKLQLQRTGWCQGREHDYKQPMDAALASAGLQLREAGSWGGLTLALHALTAACGENIQAWNDAKGRTKAEVFALLDQVIADLS